MSIIESFGKIKGSAARAVEYWQPRSWLEKLLERNSFVALVVFLAALSSFALGRLSAMEEGRESVKITFPEEKSGAAETTAAAVFSQSPSAQQALIPVPIPNPQAGEEGEGKYVGSKNGTKYHLPWCSGAKRIADANKVWFASKEEAESLGYIPAANCKGI